jgi:hypothetical protein
MRCLLRKNSFTDEIHYLAENDSQMVLARVNTNMQYETSPIKNYNMKSDTVDCFGNLFSKNYTYIKNLSTIKDNVFYSFLKKIRCAKGYYYLYCVYDSKNGITKLGKTNNPYKRTLQHVSNFIAYGNSSFEDIQCIWSRNSFEEKLNMEKEFLKAFKESNPLCPQNQLEFFSQVDIQDVNRFTFDFFNFKDNM